jgi:pyruvate dehydrogenase E1 component alpha subunit
MVKKKQKISPANDRDFTSTLYKQMLLYRRFEERVNLAYTKQKFSGFCHLHIGQEAVCAGIGACLAPDDYVISSYRSHTQAINKGIPPEAVFAELFGKATGCSGGMGGSMHMFSRERRFMGGHGIVGSQAPIATGIGFAVRYRQEKSVVICYLGDGAMNQGQIYEAFNMAALWKLPVIFVIENNQYGMGTNYHRVTSVSEFTSRAPGFNLLHRVIDGMNVLSVYEDFLPIINDVRANSTPYLVEMKTYRYLGHSVSDPATYRSKEELARYRQRDPLTQMAAHLKSLGFTNDEELEAWDQEIRHEVNAAEARAEAAEAPTEASLFQHVFVE